MFDGLSLKIINGELRASVRGQVSDKRRSDFEGGRCIYVYTGESNLLPEMVTYCSGKLSNKLDR